MIVTEAVFTPENRRDRVKRFTLKDGREIRYRNDAELQLIKETQLLQLELQEKLDRVKKPKRWFR